MKAMLGCIVFVLLLLVNLSICELFVNEKFCEIDSTKVSRSKLIVKSNLLFCHLADKLIIAVRLYERNIYDCAIPNVIVIKTNNINFETNRIRTIVQYKLGNIFL